ncbi:selenoprotein M isoform X2 [Coturnix japonica]|uniref:selenoprotein M isoform X2 n=1 Tax=Coturnix japonica TaxID=93934 RepID=UPI0007781027|nr:selenoprotein M isoform X2 [Coturnix japonica]
MRRAVLVVLLLMAAGGERRPPRGLARGKVEVKAFVSQDIPLYHNLEMKHLPGADPELVLLSFRYEELERIPLSDMTREEINQLVQELGFYRKETPEAPVPEEFQFAPAKPLPTLMPRRAPAADSKTLSEQDKKDRPDL